MHKYLYCHIVDHNLDDIFMVSFINSTTMDLKSSMLEKPPRKFDDYHYFKINKNKRVPKSLKSFDIGEMVSTPIGLKVETD